MSGSHNRSYATILLRWLILGGFVSFIAAIAAFLTNVQTIHKYTSIVLLWGQKQFVSIVLSVPAVRANFGTRAIHKIYHGNACLVTTKTIDLDNDGIYTDILVHIWGKSRDNGCDYPQWDTITILRNSGFSHFLVGEFAGRSIGTQVTSYVYGPFVVLHDWGTDAQNIRVAHLKQKMISISEKYYIYIRPTDPNFDEFSVFDFDKDIALDKNCLLVKLRKAVKKHCTNNENKFSDFHGKYIDKFRSLSHDIEIKIQFTGEKKSIRYGGVDGSEVYDCKYNSENTVCNLSIHPLDRLYFPSDCDPYGSVKRSANIYGAYLAMGTEVGGVTCYLSGFDPIDFKIDREW